MGRDLASEGIVQSLAFLTDYATGRDAAVEFANLAVTWASTTLIGLYVVQDGVFLWVNEQFARDTGFGRGELTGCRPMELVHPPDRDAVRAHARAMLAGRRASPYDYRYRSAEGTIRWALETVASVTIRRRRAVLGNFIDITDRKELEQQLVHRAFHDPLTGLPNRALLLDRLTQALERRERTPGEVAVLYLDLDDFKLVNDGHGHLAGDTLLEAIALRLSATVRRIDTLGRLSGDEFVVVIEGVDVRRDALRLAERIGAALREPFIIAGHAIAITASTGIAIATSSADRPEDLLREADTALYHAKARGKACAVVAAPPRSSR